MISWDEVSDPMEALQRSLNSLVSGLSDEEAAANERVEDVLGDILSIIRRIQEMHKNINEMIGELDSNTIYWIEVDAKYRRLSLNFAPLEIGPLMEEYLWHTKESVVRYFCYTNGQ